MISLCVIVKNEAQHLACMLESVRGVVAELIVVNTGSSDGSADIAKAYGARVFDYEWKNDFADARNFSMRQASHPWILVLDADEQLAPESCASITSLVQGEPRGLFLNRKHLCLSLSMLAVNPVAPGDIGYDRGARAYYSTHDIRLFPNDPKLAFSGTVHESIEDSMHSLGYLTERTDVLIYHYGHLASEEIKRKKSELYLTLAKVKAERDPSDWRTWYHLGAELQSQHLHSEALESFTRAIALSPEMSGPWRELAVSHHALGNTTECLNSLSKAISLDPSSMLSWAALGTTFFDLQFLNEAEHCFQTILAAEPANEAAQRSLQLIRQKKATT